MQGGGQSVPEVILAIDGDDESPVDLRGGVATYCPTCEKETEGALAAGSPTLNASESLTAAPTKGDVQGGRGPGGFRWRSCSPTSHPPAKDKATPLPLMKTEGTEGFGRRVSEEGGFTSGDFLYIAAQNGKSYGFVTVHRVDGEVVLENPVLGRVGIATCQARL